MLSVYVVGSGRVGVSAWRVSVVRTGWGMTVRVNGAKRVWSGLAMVVSARGAVNVAA